ncbi:Cytochrome b5, putative [Perkinsus marinus ATCC 50983]|uniref:Cytochrome b5, putative n=1 Tax=Perkinsus marinus (strain ATCC 50983 / TXsc) TaxID=423536 RepID=C5LCZ4_PERM5|nr:Cytochrome b5, putative [Perkinsus marinus ATCC 50983]EER05338.1 Cytochrome b5, putative [Perkinsus marinus ATCC 50983]|eukprot:XP_002773522.1 Cytochrome b5, putative [Perkinsus marinus ATCC 50983]
MSRADEKMSRNELPIITAAEVAEHTEKTDCWVILHGGVYDVTSFLAEHPGGPTVILSNAGKDLTDHFEEIGHSDFARRIAAEHRIGILEGCEDAYRIPALAEVSQSSTLAGLPGVLTWMVVAVAIAAILLVFNQ